MLSEVSQKRWGMRIASVFAVLILLPVISFAQAQTTFDWYCNFDGSTIGNDLYWFPADTATENQLREILTTMGLAPSVILRAANVPTATAVVSGNERLIYYNPEWVRRAATDSDEGWVSLAILAHEVGHHSNGHFSGNHIASSPEVARQEAELEADMFAGGALYRLGATTEQAQLAVTKLAQIFPSATHPPRSARATATLAGWNIAADAVRATNEVTAKRVLLIDSFLRRYDQTSQLPNSQYIRLIIQQIAAAEKINVAAEQLLVTKNFQDHDYVLSMKPDLIVIHLSAFFASENKTIDLAEFSKANEEFRSFVSYVLKHRPSTKILAYTRMPPESGVWDDETRSTVKASVMEQDKFLHGFSEPTALVYLPWTARFDQTDVVLAMKNAIRGILVQERAK